MSSGPRASRRRTPIYRTFHPRTWSDPSFLSLSAPTPSAQWLYVYLVVGEVTCPIPGLLRVGRGQLAETLAWELSDFDRCFDELERAQLADADWTRRVVVLPRVLALAKPQSVNAAMAWGKTLREFPLCDLVTEVTQRIVRIMQMVGRAFEKKFFEGLREDMHPSLTQGIHDAWAPGLTDAMHEHGIDGPSKSSHMSSPIQNQEHQQEPDRDEEDSLHNDTDDDVQLRFNQFWAAYPRRSSKHAALREWRKISPDAALCSLMLAAVQEQDTSPEWRRNNGQFIPNPDRWLRDGRWQDERTPSRTLEPSRAAWRNECEPLGHVPRCSTYVEHTMRLEVAARGCRHAGVCTSWTEHQQRP